VIHFAHRAFFLLVPAALPILWVLRPADVSRLRRIISVATRAAVIALLAAVLAEPSLPARTPRSPE